MTTRTALYEYLSYKMPTSLSEDWDNDGIMCLPQDGKVKKVLLSLDATKAAVEKAKNDGFDLIVTHHPMIFDPLKSVTSPKIIDIVKNNIAVFSFHTRLDACDGGVNDEIAVRLGLCNVEKFFFGRIGDLPAPIPTVHFAETIVKPTFGCDIVRLIKRTEMVRRIAVIGGAAKEFAPEAEKAGADTFLTGTMSYNTMIAAEEGGINVIEAGHYSTEFPVLVALKKMIGEFDPEIEIEIFDNNPIIVL